MLFFSLDYQQLSMQVTVLLLWRFHPNFISVFEFPILSKFLTVSTSSLHPKGHSGPHFTRNLAMHDLILPDSTAKMTITIFRCECEKPLDCLWYNYICRQYKTYWLTMTSLGKQAPAIANDMTTNQKGSKHTHPMLLEVDSVAPSGHYKIALYSYGIGSQTYSMATLYFIS